MLTSLAQQYELGTPIKTTPVDSGTVAKVWRMDTDRGAFLVRALAGREQGERERIIAQHLLSRGFSRFPAILTAADGAPMVELDGAWYQVQELLPGGMPHPEKPGTAAAMARTVKELTGALADCPPVEGAHRFEPGAAWEEGRAFWPLLETPFSPEQAAAEIARCAALPERERQVIHGDLGPWNMIQNRDGTVSVIDFGEARMGDPCFDRASALGGVINHTPPECRAAVCRDFLEELDCDRERLMEQLRLWVWRGLTQWAVLAGRGVPAARMAGRFCGALRWAEENLYDL